MRKNFYEIPKKNLLMIAGIVWLIAGYNVARLGVIAYKNIDIKGYYYVLTLAVFMMFGMMFYKMSKKHVKRIMGYEQYVAFWRFFDKKSYLIMAFMMSFGIGFRAMGIFPEVFIAFFYTGLGCALALAGVFFLANYMTKK